MSKAFNWKLWIGLLISAIFLYLAFRQVELPRVWHVIRSTNPLFLFLVIALTFLQYVIRAWRWGILMEPIKRTGFMNRLDAVLIGFGANCVLPARLGEFIRASFLGNLEATKGSSVFGTIVVERLFDGFTLLLFLLIGLMGTEFPKDLQSFSASLKGVGLVLLITYSAFVAFLIGFKYKAKKFIKVLDRIFFFLPGPIRSRLMEILWNFSLGLVLLKHPSRWILAVLYSVLLWFTSLCQIQLTEYAVGLTLPFIATFLILTMASFGVMIPSAPGFIGTFHLSVQYAFLLYGIDREEALSSAIIWHAALFLPTIAFGLFSFIRLHLSFRGFSKNSLIIEKQHISDSYDSTSG